MANSYIMDRVHNTDDGFIVLDGERIQQGEAIDLALALTVAVQSSINRTQMKTPGYYTAEAIVRRSETKLGRAIVALERIYGR